MGDLINQAIENNVDDFKILKKHYGERFAKLCRSLFPTILEEKGVLSNLIMSKFAPSRFLYEDLVDNYATDRFQKFIYGENLKSSHDFKEINFTPEQLFEKAGYILYKCETNEDIHKFEKYYAKGESICTFTDPDRIKKNTIFFAVKKDVDKFKRDSFKNPNINDDYSTSVICIQFTKGRQSAIKIISRYNHALKDSNPDATFGTDLDEIYYGLVDSFHKYYNITPISGKHPFQLPNYVIAKDGKYYRYNYEIDNVYYCPNNIIIDNSEPKYYDSRRYDLIDYFIIDKQEKNISDYNTFVNDSFIDLFKDNWGVSQISKIEISKQNDEKTFRFVLTNDKIITVVVDKYNQIVELHSLDTTLLLKGFLRYNKSLRKLNTPNVSHIENYALYNNQSIRILNLPNVEIIKDRVMNNNHNIEEILCPNLQYLGNESFRDIRKVKSLSFPKLENIGQESFKYSENLEEFIAPKLKNLKQHCLQHAIKLKSIDVRNIETMEARALQYVGNLTEFIAPKLKIMDSFCLSECKILEAVDLSNLEEMGSYCFNSADSLKILNLPKITTIDGSCFEYTNKLKRVYAPNLINLGSHSFAFTPELKKFTAPKLNSSTLLAVRKRNERIL